MATSLGQAFVEIVGEVDTAGIERQMEQALRNVDRQAARDMASVERTIGRAGDDAGEAFAQGLSDGIRDGIRDLERLEREGDETAGELRRSLEGFAEDMAREVDEGVDEAVRDLKRLERQGEDTANATDGVGASAGASSEKLVGLAKRGLAAAGGIAALGAAAVGFTRLVVGSTNAAADLGESVNAINVVLGEGAGSFLEFGSTASDQLGITQAALNEAVVPLASVLAGADIQGEQLSTTLQELATRATDVASVFNTDTNEVVLAFGAALRGEAEPARRFGVNLDAARIEAKALELGLVDAGGELTNYAKRTAAVAIVMEDTDRTAGDFQNTITSLPNLMRRASAAGTDLQATFGQGFLGPAEGALQLVLDGIIDLRDEAADAGEELGEAFAPVLEDVVPAFFNLAEAAIPLVVEGIDSLLQAAQPAIDIFVALGDAAEWFTDRGAEADTQANRLDASLDELASGGRQSATDVALLGDSIAGLVVQQREAETFAGRLTDRVRDAIPVFNLLGDTSLEQFTDQVGDAVDVFGDLVQGGDLEGAADLLASLRVGADGAGISLGELADTFPELLPLVAELNAATAEQAAVTAEAAGEQAALALAYSATDQELNEYLSSLRAAVDPAFAYSDAQATLNEALDAQAAAQAAGDTEALAAANEQVNASLYDMDAAQRAAAEAGLTITEQVDGTLALADAYGLTDEQAESLSGTVREVATDVQDANDTAKRELAGVEDSFIALNDVVTDAAQGIVDAMGVAADDAPAVVEAMAADIRTSLADLDLEGVGLDVIEGFIRGTEAGRPLLVQSLTKTLGDARLAVELSERIESPSRRWADEIGEPITQGIAMGITNASGDVERALEGVTSPDVARATGVDNAITASINEALNLLEGELREQAEAINRVLGAGTVPTPNIRKFRLGGMVDEPTLGVFGEAGAELLLPLEQGHRRMVDLLRESVPPSAMQDALGPSSTQRAAVPVIDYKRMASSLADVLQERGVGATIQVTEVADGRHTADQVARRMARRAKG